MSKGWARHLAWLVLCENPNSEWYVVAAFRNESTARAFAGLGNMQVIPKANYAILKAPKIKVP